MENKIVIDDFELKELFANKGNTKDVETFEITKEDLDNGILLTELLVNANLVSSKSEGKRMIEQNGISLNGTKETDAAKTITKDDFEKDGLLIQKGKKSFKKIIIKYI